MEEIICRVFAWPMCRDRDRPRSAFLVVGPLVVALVHWEAGLATVCVAWDFGVLAAGLYLVLGTLWPVVVAHAVTHFTVFC